MCVGSHTNIPFKVRLMDPLHCCHEDPYKNNFGEEVEEPIGNGLHSTF
jgi:hypothetical protein